MLEHTPDKWVKYMLAIRNARDKEAFREIFEYFAPRVKAFLMKSDADVELAEDCVQDTMVTVWHKAHLFDPGRASVSTWIFSIARNKKIDVLRKRNRPEPEDLPWGPEPDDMIDDVLTLQSESKRLRDALNDLPEKQRDIISRAFYGELTHQELSEETGLPLGTIKSRIRLALERLRHTIIQE